MKRECHTYDAVGAVWPIFFWKICCKCGMEFRREKGWTACGYNDMQHWVCNSCAPTKKEAAHVLVDSFKTGSARIIIGEAH